MKNILIISFHFPPDAAVGAVRSVEFAKNLKQYGWQPTILSVKEKYYGNLDREKYDVREFRIVRTRKLCSINDVYLFAKRIFSVGNKVQKNNATNKEWFTQKAETFTREPVKSKLTRYYNSLLVYIPDKEIGWLIFAVLKGVVLVKKDKIDAILTTSPPHSVHLVGLVIKMLTGKPWIADFRDPWKIELKPRRSRSRLSDVLESKMEKSVINNSDWVVSVTKKMTERLKNLYPDSSEKFVTITNGYDSDALLQYMQVELYSTYTITYVGSLYFGRDPSVFLKAVSELIEEGMIERNELRIQLIGDCRVSDGKSVEDMVNNYCLEDIVTFVDQISHQEALKEIAKSQVLLLMAPCQPLQIPGKVFEYIGMRKKILSVCESGATKSFLQNYPLAHVVAPNNLDEMKQTLAKLFVERNENTDGKLQEYPFEQYERKSIAHKVASLLEKSMTRSA